MKHNSADKVSTLLHLFDLLPENERIIVDVLRQIIIENLPANHKEKLSFNVPSFYGKKGICIVWPATIRGGGVKQGVLLGFWQGNRLNDVDSYLTRGTNKRIFYKIFKTVDDIDQTAIVKLLKEAVRIDKL